jgi:hypothetical protein
VTLTILTQDQETLLGDVHIHAPEAAVSNGQGRDHRVRPQVVVVVKVHACRTATLDHDRRSRTEVPMVGKVAPSDAPIPPFEPRIMPNSQHIVCSQG